MLNKIGMGIDFRQFFLLFSISCRKQKKFIILAKSVKRISNILKLFGPKLFSLIRHEAVHGKKQN